MVRKTLYCDACKIKLGKNQFFKQKRSEKKKWNKQTTFTRFNKIIIKIGKKKDCKFACKEEEEKLCYHQKVLNYFIIEIAKKNFSEAKEMWSVNLNSIK